MEDIKITLNRNELNGKFELDLNNLLQENPKSFDRLLLNPEDVLDKIKSDNEVLLSGLDFSIVNCPDFIKHKISNLRSRESDRLVRVSGILKKVNSCKSFFCQVKFECPSCGTVISVQQKDTKITSPKRCVCGRRGSFNIISKETLDWQEMELEENVEDIGSKQPMKIKIILEDGLTDPNLSKYQVGNKVDVIGIYKEMPNYLRGKDGDFTIPEYMVKVLYMTSKDGFEEDLLLSEDELKQIKEIAYNKPLDILSKNIAPNIRGLEHIKESLVLYLAKGVTKNTGNERRRGESHMLIIGDPGLGKTALIQNIQKRAFNCRITDGKNTTGAGIVASMRQEKDTNQWSIEAGDMVLANNGYLIIDESEKMSSDDIKVLHRPMEQGESVISKAGTKATLSTKTAVLSVANPKTGRFQDNESIIKQVDFSSSFLSRFDLIYVLRDNPNKDEDELTISKIVNTHKGVMEGTLSQEFMKKYFMYVSKLRPELTTEAGERIIKTYVHLRDLSKKDGRTVGIPISPRYGETLIRLSEAHAKIRLSDKVEIVDVGIAEKLLTRSLSDFGVNLQLGVIDTSSVTTIVPLSKVTEYRLVLETLRKIAETTDNIFETKEVLPKLSLQLGMSIENLEKNIEMARGNGELYFPRTHTFKLLLD